MYIEEKLMKQLCKKMSKKEQPITPGSVHRILDKKMKKLGFADKRISTFAISNYYYGVSFRKYASKQELSKIEKNLKEIRDYELKKSQLEHQIPQIQRSSKVKTVTKIVPEKKKLQKLINIHTYPSDFYRKLQKDINLAYTYEIYSAVLILLRKLIENLVIGILRKKYGSKTKENVNLYFNTDRKQFKPLNTLIKNLDSKIKEKDFDVFPQINNDLIKELNKYREVGNSSAHTIEVDLTKDDMKKYKENLEFILNILIQTFNSL